MNIYYHHLVIHFVPKSKDESQWISCTIKKQKQNKTKQKKQKKKKNALERLNDFDHNDIHWVTNL